MGDYELCFSAEAMSTNLLTLVQQGNTQKPAIHIPEGDFQVTYGELLDSMRRIQGQITLEGKLQPTQTVAIVAPNGFPILATFLGCATARMKVSPLNPAYGQKEFEFYLGDTEAKALIIDAQWESHPSRDAATQLGIPIWVLRHDQKSVHIENPNAEKANLDSFDLIHPEESDVALFLHTSGTTSTPKGVPLNHKNLATSVGNIANTYQLTSDDTCMVVMPLFHVHGLIGATLSTLSTGGSIIVPP